MNADIVSNLGRPDLSIDAFARAYQITARQIERLFEAEGTSFSADVRQPDPGDEGHVFPARAKLRTCRYDSA